MMNDGSGGGRETGEPLADAGRLLRMHRRRLEQIRAEQARLGQREWRELFRQMEQVLRQICGNARLMADPETQRIIQRMLAAPDMEALNFEFRLLADRLSEMAGVPKSTPGMTARSSDSQGLALCEHRPANGRLRLRL